MPLNAGAYPYVIPTDKLANYPAHSERLARLLDLPGYVEITSSGSYDQSANTAFTNVVGVPRATIDLTPPAGAPAGIGALCLIHGQVLVKLNSGGSAQLRLGVGIVDDLTAWGEPGVNDVRGHTHNGVLNPSSAFESVAVDFPVVLRRLASLRLKVAIGGSMTVGIGYGRINITPIRWVD